MREVLTETLLDKIVQVKKIKKNEIITFWATTVLNPGSRIPDPIYSIPNPGSRGDKIRTKVF
jgi:hypothetical protein